MSVVLILQSQVRAEGKKPLNAWVPGTFCCPSQSQQGGLHTGCSASSD